MTDSPRQSRARDAHLSSLQLSTYADGETPREQQAEIEAHLASCASCAAKLESLRSIAVTLSALRPTTPSAGVFDRVLAGVRQVDKASTGVAREGLSRRRAHGPVRLREVRLPDMDTPRAVTRRRAGWRAPFGVAFPTIAALLLLTFAAALLVRASLTASLPPVTANPTATIRPGDTLKATRQAMQGVKGQLQFEPVLPSYLPDGARLDTVRLSRFASGQTALDVSWVMTAGPLRALHLREQLAGEPPDGYVVQSAAVADLAWQVGEYPVWRQMDQVEAKGWQGVTQRTAKGVTLLLDAAPASGASQADVAQALRLTSLALDVPYSLPGVAIVAPDQSALVRAQAIVTSGSGQSWTWDVTTSADTISQSATIHNPLTGASVTEITEGGGAGILLDRQRVTYQMVLGPTYQPQVPSAVTEIGHITNSSMATGQLWNLGVITRAIPGLGNQRVYDLYHVGTMRPQHVYADAVTGEVLAIYVDTTAAFSPGGDGSPQPYISTAVCRPYTVTYQWVIFEPASQAAATFDTTPPRQYKPGVVSPPFNCD